MADAKASTATAADDAVDTSNTTEAAADDADFEDDKTSWADGETVDDKGSEEESPAGDSKDETKSDPEEDVAKPDKKQPAKAEPEADPAKEETKDQEAADSDLKDKSPPDDSKDVLTEEERKKHNDEMAKARIAEKEAQDRASKAKTEAEEATIERYLREAGDDDMELERRQLNVEAFRVQEAKISVNEDKLQAGIDRAVASIDLFKSGSPAVQEELASSLDDFERMYVKKDDQGRPLEVVGDVVQFLQAKADSIKRLQGEGATQQGKDKSKQQSRTITPPVKAPKRKQADEGEKAFDDEANRW